jgi:3-dehydroquinate synthase
VTTITVRAGNAVTDVLVGPLAAAAPRLQALAKGRTLPLVTDERIWRLHGERISAILPVEPLFVPEGEEAKQWGPLQDLIAAFARLNIDRASPVLALGGGAVGDLTGLAAGLFKRGCPVVHLPTTLLAQADSAVGGKTAIDAEGQKNLLGLFHQPALVVADPAFLETLDPRQLASGYAEIVKYGLIDDAEFFGWCEANGAELLAGNLAARTLAVTHAITAKARFVEADVEDRNGTRALLNLGHSFGHAIEAAAGLGTVLHGEAVAVGCVLALRFSAEQGLCAGGDADRVAAHLASAGLPTTLGEVGLSGSGETLVALMAGDKKNEGGRLKLILARGIGQAFVADGVDVAAVRTFLDQH